MKHRIITIIFSIFLTVLFSCKFFKGNGINVVDRDDFRGIENLYLVGVVDSIQRVINKMEGYHGRGIIRVNIIKSNINEYDPRNRQVNYYCIIKNGKAEIYEHPGRLKKGDTITLDVKERKIIYHHSNGNLGGLSNIWISPVSFFDFIKKKGYQKL
jgi:predicted NUDIX family phosphoesterase